jgi:hypothetical protein
MLPATVRVQAGFKLASSLAHPAWRDLDAIPVVDRDDVMLGILRHRQLRRIQTSEAGGDLKDTLFSLSELCWMGLSTLMLPSNIERAPGSSEPMPREGGGHGN